MLEDFLKGCIADVMATSYLMTATATIGGVAVTCTRDAAQRSGRYEAGGLATIGNLYLGAKTSDLAAINADVSALLGDVATVDGVAWRIFGVNTGPALTTLTLQRDTEGG